MSNRINYLMENWERAGDGRAFLGNLSSTDLQQMEAKYLRRGEDGLAAEVRKALGGPAPKPKKAPAEKPAVKETAEAEAGEE